MKKSKKLMRLKRVSCCGGCKYAHFIYSDGDEMFCIRHHDSSICFFDSPCSHYVPFNDIMFPRKTPYYWLGSVDDDYIPF